jgi:hypothetical protein
VKLEQRSRVDWQATEDQRMDEIEQSVHNIFSDAIAGRSIDRKPDTPPFISTGTPTGGQAPEISTAKITETTFTVVPTEKLFTLLSRMQNSNHFLKSAKSREESGQLRQTLPTQNVQRLRKCPYYVGARTRGIRIDAIFKLRSVRRHSYFRRRDRKVVNPELQGDLEFVQDKFDHYVEDIRDLKCALVHRQNGTIKLIDYQTRFTDETRKDGTIARFYRTWEKAGESFNTAVFLTLTSYPPSEAPKHLYRQSLWHVDRHYAIAWNAYMAKLAKRERAARRDDLLDGMRLQVQKVRAVFMDQKTSKVRLRREERIAALEPMKGQSFRPKYLQVYEFQKNGMIHGHCVIFGKHWLDSFEQIKRDWQLTGQGERIHIYALHKEGEVWQWSKGSPQDSRNRQPVDYLMKYLGKGVRLSSGHGMYWAVNKRFFTNSQALISDRDLPVDFEKLPVQYEYLGSFRGEDLPPWLITDHRRKATAGGDSGGGWLDPLGFGIDRSPGVPA